MTDYGLKSNQHKNGGGNMTKLNKLHILAILGLVLGVPIGYFFGKYIPNMVLVLVFLAALVGCFFSKKMEG